MASRLAAYQGSWTPVTARHLLNRAGFGVPLERLDGLASLDLDRAVKQFTSLEGGEDDLERPDWLNTHEDLQALRMKFRNVDRESRRKLRQELRREERQDVVRLQEWWLKRMFETPRPLQEKMALFWHGHFATSAQKVRSAALNYQLNRIFRDHGLGSFRTLVLEVAKSGAMLRYLDNISNRKGHPNENWARELMELFTIGIGNYTEQDIKEAARAFTGWTWRQGKFVKHRRSHDYGRKTFMGQTGSFDGEDIVDIILKQPETARFISRKLWEHFVYESPDDELVEELAALLRKNDYQLKPLMETIFRSREFYSQRAVASQIKSPVQLLLGLFDQLESWPRRRQLTVLALRSMGQMLFYCPNVEGWPGNRDWINTNSLLIRYNITSYLVNGIAPNRGSQRRRVRRNRTDFDPAKLIGEKLSPPATWGELIDGLCDYFLGRPLDAEQRAILIEACGSGMSADSGFDLESASDETLRGIVHLILSAAEYQLC